MHNPVEPAPAVSKPIRKPTRVALHGFTSFEQTTFETFFRLAPQRTPAYVLAADLAHCDTAVVNADDEAAVADLRGHGLLDRALLLGATPCPGAGTQLARPINLMLVVRALDTLSLKAPAPSASVQRVLDDLMSITTALPAGLDTRALAASAQDRPHHPRTMQDHILVVDDNDITLRLMAGHLQRFGFQMHLARSGAEALERVARRTFEFVFIHVGLEGLDGFHTCRAIKRNSAQDPRRPPAVVLLTDGQAAVDRLRGDMVGADACLGLPLREDDLLKVVGDREVTRHAYAKTTEAANSMI